MTETGVPSVGDPDVPLHSGPAAPGSRALMTIRDSTDGGPAWRPAHPADGLPAVCSDPVRIDAGTVGLRYGTRDFGAHGTVALRRVPVTRLT